MLGTDFPENILPDDDGLSFLDAVTPILSAARRDVRKSRRRVAGRRRAGQAVQGQADLLPVPHAGPLRHLLKLAGFDVMSLANNHARDFGEEGRSSTMAALDAVGIHHSGREGTIASWIANGRRIALVAFAPNVGSNLLNEPEPARALVAELAATHDIVIVSFHGGAEGNGAEDPAVRARSFRRARIAATWWSSRTP